MIRNRRFIGTVFTLSAASFLMAVFFAAVSYGTLELGRIGVPISLAFTFIGGAYTATAIGLRALEQRLQALEDSARGQ